MGSFSRSLSQYYQAKLLSQAGIFCLIVWYLILAIPFYLSFSTSCTHTVILDFWTTPAAEFVPVSYLFTGRYVANIKYYNGGGGGQTTFATSNIPSVQLSNMSATAPVFSLSGLTVTPTTHSISATITVAPTSSTLAQIELLLFFQLTIPILNAKYMVTSVVNVPWTSGVQTTTLTGLLDYSNKQTLSAISINEQDFNFAPYFKDFSYQSNFSTIKDNAYSSNYMLQTTIMNTDVIRGTTAPLRFNLQLISKPTAILTYYTGFLQTLKMAFSQYTSLWLIAYLLGTGLLVQVARRGVFSMDKQQTQLRFLNNQQY